MKQAIAAISALVIADAFVWILVCAPRAASHPELYFLDVGQGDAEFVHAPGNIKMLIDGGPDNRALKELALLVSPMDRYIDIVALSHPQTDHMNGLIDVVKRYRIGVFIWNGERGAAKSFSDLKAVLEEAHVPMVTVREGDAIRYGESRVQVLGPSAARLNAREINEDALVLRFEGGGLTALFTGDVGEKTEKELRANNLRSRVLKVGHHGSKHSSSELFLKAVAPAVAVIEVGKNSYGHPTAQVLDRLAAADARVFRTDRNGTVKIEEKDGRLVISTRR